VAFDSTIVRDPGSDTWRRQLLRPRLDGLRWSAFGCFAWLLASVGFSGCSIVPAPPVCPATFDEARFEDFETVGDDSLVATGTVIRFVNSPDPDFRGYDIAVARHSSRSRTPEGRVPDGAQAVVSGVISLMI
jgi:hypothetical protein